MADENYTLVGDNDAPAEWTDVNNVTPDQKVLIATVDERSGNLKATWRPSSQAAVFIEKTITENGVHDPQQEGADGYSMVTAAVAATLSDADLVSSIATNGSYALWYYIVSPSVIHFTAAADVPAEGVTTLGTITVSVE